MGVCVPQHVVCDWFTPEFKDNGAPCTLASFNEYRARTTIFGNFFRSKDVGSQYNNLKIECSWITNTLDGGNQPIGTIVGTASAVAMNAVWVKLFNKNVLIQEWFVAQHYTPESSPGAADDFWDTNAIPSLESRINSDSNCLIEMNQTDVQASWPPSDPYYVPPDHLIHFPIRSLSGGASGPINPNSYRPTIRTGPAMSLILIAWSEKGIADGSMRNINKTRYWNGACWKAYDPKHPDCADPDNPQGCALGPESKCIG